MKMAKLYFRYGAMNSGKSTLIMQVAYNYEERGMKAIIVKPKIDIKGSAKIVSRLGVERKVDVLLAETDNIFKIIEKRVKEQEKISCIIVDEAQFLTEIQVEQLFKITVKLNIPVLCYGLRNDFKTKGFPGSSRLLQLAHTIEEIKTICRCGRKAIFNLRKINDEFVFNGDQVAIDEINNVSYESVCGDCYYKYSQGECKAES
jgi:thymidine kinase